MKMQELSNTELNEINGGSIFGGNDSSSSNSGILGSLGVGNLLSFSSASQNGDQSQSSSFSIGNGIGANLGGALSKMTSSI